MGCKINHNFYKSTQQTGKFINEFMFCATELKTFRTFHQ